MWICRCTTAGEGYSFKVWSDGNTDNPRKIVVSDNIALTAIFEVNVYKLTYVVDGEEYKTVDVAYGTAIEPEAAPVKEGHSFSGWEGLPETMPAHDVTVTGSFTVNIYKAVFKIGDEVIATKEVVYGEPIPEVDAPESHLCRVAVGSGDDACARHRDLWQLHGECLQADVYIGRRRV